jgi:hypothetical protein
LFFGETIITYSFAVRFLYRKDQHALVSSGICLVIGSLFAIGLYQQ